MAILTTVPILCDGAGAFAFTVPKVHGRILGIQYTIGTIAATADISITTGTTLQNVWVELNLAANRMVCPRLKTQGTDGTDWLYAAAGVGVAGGYVWAINESLIITIAQGGAAGAGTLRIITDE